MENKPYFANYLPVEGEPKKDDVVIWEEVGWTEDYEKAKASAPYGGRIPHKAKLFLCSRDIQVGDKITHIHGEVGEAESISESGIVLKNSDWPHTSKEDWFKVIGEISPEAIWVKEGDEFSESEIEEWWGQAITHYPMIRKLHADTWGFKELSENCPIVYKVKGPCGHLH